MYILHHTDNDGLLSAAIIKNERYDVFAPMTADRMTTYNYDTEKIDTISCTTGEKIYIVDLSLDKVLSIFILDCVKQGAIVIHIDHHKTTKDFVWSDEETEIIKGKYMLMHNNEVSGCMLSWIYSCANKVDPAEFTYEWEDNFNTIRIEYTDGILKQFSVPEVVKFVDDNDVWRHAFKDSRLFKLGTEVLTDEELDPFGTLWVDLLYNSPAKLYEVIQQGVMLDKFKTAQNQKMMKTAFVSDAFGLPCMCLNIQSIAADSTTFGQSFNEYPVCCKFHYDGKIYKYTLYSKELIDENGEDIGIDVSLICKRFGGGGHKHAGCFSSPMLMI